MTVSTTDYLDDMKACAEAINLGVTNYVQPEDRWVRLNDLDFHYLDWGNSHLPPLLLLHGGSLTAHTWDMAALLLRDQFHVIALDQRGHGDSGWTAEALLGENNQDLMAADTEAFINYLAYPRIVLCGMSMGGMNSLRYAAKHADRLARLIIVDIAPVTMQEGLMEMEAFRRETETMSKFEDFLERAVKFNPQRKPAHLKYSLLHSLKQVDDGWTWKQDHRPRPETAPPPSDEAAKEQMQAMRRERSESLWADVKAITTPTLLMRGAISKILSEEAAKETVAAMTDAELVVIPNAGHSVQGDNPQAFATELKAFIDRRGLS